MAFFDNPLEGYIFSFLVLTIHSHNLRGCQMLSLTGLRGLRRLEKTRKEKERKGIRAI